MNKIIATFFYLLVALSASAQSDAESVSKKIAQRMKDSLALTAVQMQNIYDINMQLHQQRVAVWQQYNNNRPQIQSHLQLIENTRDSLYKPVLTAEQFTQYRQKKLNLLNNN
ncbi:MAG: hypothetical protein QM731_02055 [Chitinophagaceae bacterium]